MTQETAPVQEQEKETVQQKIAGVQSRMLVFAKMHGWKQDKAKPGIWTHERKNDTGLDVINFTPSGEYPGTHHLGRVYVSHDGEAIYDNEMFDEHILEYIIKAQEEAALAGIKVPMPGALPVKEKTPAAAQTAPKQQPTSNPTPNPKPQQQKASSNLPPNIESRKQEQIARAQQMIAETPAKPAPVPEKPKIVMPEPTEPKLYTAVEEGTAVTGTLIVITGDEIQVTLLKPGETVKIPIKR